MFLLNTIKYDADKNYDLYENEINQYYELNNNYNMISLTNYIYKFYIGGICWYTKYTEEIDIYVQNLYYRYSDYYISKICNDYIITEQLLFDFVNENWYETLVVKYIVTKTGYNIKIQDFIKKGFENIDNLPLNSLWEVDIKDVYIVLAKLLDFIIKKNINFLILDIVINRCNN